MNTLVYKSLCKCMKIPVRYVPINRTAESKNICIFNYQMLPHQSYTFYIPTSNV